MFETLLESEVGLKIISQAQLSSYTKSTVVSSIFPPILVKIRNLVVSILKYINRMKVKIFAVLIESYSVNVIETKMLLSMKRGIEREQKERKALGHFPSYWKYQEWHWNE